MANIITLANIKGGVGKTTAAVNIAYTLASQYQKRVLVIDSDDQCNATKALGVRQSFDPATQCLWAGIYSRRGYQDVMVKSPHENIWVVPATKELRKAQLEFGQSARALKLFRHLLRGVEEDFDVVLIDTKPQVNVLLQAALAASDWYLIPSFPESDSYDGFVDLVAECEEIREEENPSLNCLGLFYTCVKRNAAHDTYMDFAIKLLRDANVDVLPTHIRASDTVATGALRGVPSVALQHAKSVRHDYGKVTEHLLGELKEDKRGRPRKRPDLRRLGLLEQQMAPGRHATLSLVEDEGDEQLFA